MTPMKDRFSLTFPMKRWSALATHLMAAFRPFWGRIALPAHWAKRARANRGNKISVSE
jgi:hypothetical protein